MAVAGMLLCAVAGMGVEHVRQSLLASGSRGKPMKDAPAVKPLPPRPAVKVRDESAERAVAALRRRVAELERDLAARDAAVKQLVEERLQPQGEPARVEEALPRRQSFAERMEHLKKENPEQYAELNELYGDERRYLLEATARAVGYEGAQAAEFADQVQSMIDNTTMMPPRFGRGDPQGGPPHP